MSKLKLVIAMSLLVCIGYAGSAFALLGVGIHYSLDFTVKMDQADEQLVFNNLKLSTAGFGTIPSGWANTTFTPNDIPIYFKRSSMGRTPFGLGGKVYVDIIPFIDCIELGGDFAAFQYDGKIKYPKSIGVNATAPATPGSLLTMQDAGQVTVVYDSLSTNLEDISGAPGIPGISKTPYAKLDLGLTVRKYIPIPVIDNVFRPYGGLGFDVIFATPVPSAGLVNDAIGADLTGTKSVAEVVTVMQDPATSKKIVDELLARLMTPHFGMNIVVGFMIKPPVVPLALYVDGKYVIPFGKLDKDAGVTAQGFKINAGLALHFGAKK
jgi:hypothetical protein